ncbi:acetate/propionate family kinase [Ruegeria marina]|uniref:Acetate kinase n=1 Tax=Ruegeria marina TaxID=639004 RepID=A0A1G6I9D1_9RHOB|nr:acetate/propionate family kinase [Ruegeria marina]SDC03104.1 acetate kinase [Ruegeria marina]
MTANTLVTLNAGSSSLRCAVFDRTDDGPRPRIRLSLRGLPARMILERRDLCADETEEFELDPPEDKATAQGAARATMVQRLVEEVDEKAIAAISHRVVHGGARYADPVKVDSTVLSRLDALSPLAPSHQPHNLDAIRDLSERFPGVPQIACFDTAFHRSLPHNDRIFALPRHLSEEGVVRYGFHGLSYEHVAAALAGTRPALARGRVIVAHLGHGVSMCALKGGTSVATTMGMTALDGLPMGRRPGALDPGIILYLIEERGMSPADLRDMLYERSGLLGLSGISGEMPDLLASDSKDAARAVDFFVYRCQREIGSLAAALGGLDGLVFTGGIGEHAPAIRKRICSDLGWLGVVLDEGANRKGATQLSAAQARVTTLMIPTDEESVLARHAEGLLRS